MNETDDTPRKAPQALLDALARSDADIAAGRTVDSATVHREIREAIARIKARRTAAE